jgi:fructose-1,6-bisphosphatase/inositol monophosphatase family enzyme
VPCHRVDRESERIITKILRSSFPNHGIVGEEGASRESSGEDGLSVGGGFLLTGPTILSRV